MVNFLHENPVKSPPIHSPCDTSVIAPVRASSVQSVCTLCNMTVVAPVHVSSIQPICTSCVTSVLVPVHASPILSALPYDNKRQEFLDGFPSTMYGEKNPSQITVKFPHNITLTLQQAKFPEENPDTTMRVLYLGNFMLT